MTDYSRQERLGFDTTSVTALQPSLTPEGPERTAKSIRGLSFIQSGRPDSNRRPSAWEADALPTELRPHPYDSLRSIENFVIVSDHLKSRRKVDLELHRLLHLAQRE